MKYYHDLYMSEAFISKKNEILDKLENNKWQLEKYVVALSKGEQNHLEIFHSVLLLQKAIDKENLFVVGITKDMQEALQLVEKITQEVYDKTGDADIRNYILQKQREYEEGNV